MTDVEAAARRDVAVRMGEAAEAFIASLDAAHRKVASWTFPSQAERELWFFTPTDHGGLTLSDMTPRQQSLALALLGTGLSQAGYFTVSTIMGLENVLDHLEGHRIGVNHVRFRDPGRYYVSVFGDPGDPTWGWRFGGHHVSISNTIVDGQLAAGTPSFLGADPASTPLLGPHLLRPLAGLQDTALALMHQLDPQLRARAIVSPVPPVDIVGGNRPSIDVGDGYLEPMRLSQVFRDRFDEAFHQQLERGQDAMEQRLGFTAEHAKALRLTATPAGLAASDMNSLQRDTLKDLLGQYIRRLPDAVADAEFAKIVGERFDGLHLAWAGSTQLGEPMYYRIQGERLVIELDCAQRDGNHMHSIWRDPQGDFGSDLLARHYAVDHAGDHHHHGTGH